MLFLEKTTHTQFFFLLGEGKENHLKFTVERYELLLTLIYFTFTTQHQDFIIFLPLLLSKSLSGTKVLVSVEMVNSKPSQQQH